MREWSYLVRCQGVEGQGGRRICRKPTAPYPLVLLLPAFDDKPVPNSEAWGLPIVSSVPSFLKNFVKLLIFYIYKIKLIPFGSFLCSLQLPGDACRSILNKEEKMCERNYYSSNRSSRQFSSLSLELVCKVISLQLIKKKKKRKKKKELVSLIFFQLQTVWTRSFIILTLLPSFSSIVETGLN